MKRPRFKIRLLDLLASALVVDVVVITLLIHNRTFRYLQFHVMSHNACACDTVKPHDAADIVCINSMSS